jgi:hypothetical protein
MNTLYTQFEFSATFIKNLQIFLADLERCFKFCVSLCVVNQKLF